MAALVGNPHGGVTIPILGVPHLYFIAVAASCIALATFIALARTAARHVAPIDLATAAGSYQCWLGAARGWLSGCVSA